MADRPLRRNGGMGERRVDVVAAEKKVDVPAVSHLRGGVPALDAISDVWTDMSPRGAASRLGGDP